MPNTFNTSILTLDGLKSAVEKITGQKPKQETKERWLRTITSVATVTVSFTMMSLTAAKGSTRLRELYEYLNSDQHFLEITEMPAVDRNLTYRITVDLSDGADLVTLLQPLMRWDPKIRIVSLTGDDEGLALDVRMAALQARLDAAESVRPRSLPSLADVEKDLGIKTPAWAVRPRREAFPGSVPDFPANNYDPTRETATDGPRKDSFDALLERTPTISGERYTEWRRRTKDAETANGTTIGEGNPFWKSRSRDAEYDASLERDKGFAPSDAGRDGVDLSTAKPVVQAAPAPDKERGSRSELADVEVAPAREGLRAKREL